LPPDTLATSSDFGFGTSKNDPPTDDIARFSAPIRTIESV
jgi:hypothetical protein